MEFPRQEYWSMSSFPPLGDLPNTDWTRISASPALAGGFFTTGTITKLIEMLTLYRLSGFHLFEGRQPPVWVQILLGTGPDDECPTPWNLTKQGGQVGVVHLVGLQQAEAGNRIISYIDYRPFEWKDAPPELRVGPVHQAQ